MTDPTDTRAQEIAERDDATTAEDAMLATSLPGGWTKGPWMVREDGEVFLIEAEDGELLTLKTSWHRSTRLRYPLKAEALANARLAATSPCLYEALAEIFEGGAVQVAFAGNPIAIARLEAKCRLALSRAHGEVKTPSPDRGEGM